MFTKEEMQFTVNQMIDHAIFCIEQCLEYDLAVEYLTDAKGVLQGNQDTARFYWASQADPFGHDFDSTTHHLCADQSDTSKMMIVIFSKVLT